MGVDIGRVLEKELNFSFLTQLFPKKGGTAEAKPRPAPSSGGCLPHWVPPVRVQNTWAVLHATLLPPTHGWEFPTS